MITFVETPTPWNIRKNAQVSLGPIYLATILKQNGFDVRITRPNNIHELEPFLNSDIIAFTGTTLEFPMVKKCAQFVKKHNPDILTWYGGIHATVMYKEFLQNELFDSIILGESEMLISKIAKDSLERKHKPLYCSSHFPQITNLDTIPIPDRDLIQGSHGGGIFAFEQDFVGHGNENIISARGCPFDCHFCASKAMFNCVRFRSVENILSEVDDIIEKYEARQFRFADDNLTSKKSRLLHLCRELKDRKIVFRASARVHNLDKDTAKALYEAGCREISVGVESGDQRVLDFLNKHSNLEKVSRGCRIAIDAGIHIRAMLLTGTPGEYKDTPELTMEYIEKSAFHSISLSSFIPLPGSQIFNHPERYNCEIVDYDFSKYNRDFWVWKNEGRDISDVGIENLLIRNLSLTKEEQIDNVKRMKDYVQNSPLNNFG